MPETRAWRERPRFRLGEVEVRPASNEIVVDGTVVRLKPRLMDVLLRLAATPGESMPRETLLAEAWPGRMVNDDVLSRVIADLRGALRDDAREARFIETLPKVGYRLVAAVSPVEEPAIAARPAHAFFRTNWIPAALAGAVAAVVLLLLLHPVAPPAPGRDELTRQLANAEPFSSDVDLEIAPRFSPEGTRIAFAAGLGRCSTWPPAAASAWSTARAGRNRASTLRPTAGRSCTSASYGRSFPRD